MNQANVLGIIDLSGSMTGQPIAAAKNQTQELLSALQSAQRFSPARIRLGLLGFHSEAQWLMRPADVGEILDLPALRIPVAGNGFCPRGSFAAMLDALAGALQDGEDTHLILLSDMQPTDPEKTLRSRMDRMARSRAFQRCRRYVIREESEPRLRAGFAWLEQAFAGQEGYVTDAAGFSAMAARLQAELTGGGHAGPETVF